MTIIDDLAPYLLTFILFVTAVLITRLFKIKDMRVILLSFSMLEVVFYGVTGNFGIGIAVLSIVIVILMTHYNVGAFN